MSAADGSRAGSGCGRSSDGVRDQEHSDLVHLLRHGRPSGCPELPEPPEVAADTAVTVAELHLLKEEKLAVIRRALEKGDYDSDVILEKALDRMLERLEEADRE